MSRGSSNTRNTRLIFANIKGTKQGEEVHIAFKDAETKKDLPNDTAVGGYVTFMDTQAGVSKFDGLPYETLRLFLEDPAVGETVALSISMNSVGRNIVNAMSTIEGPIGFLEISVKMNDNGYATSFVSHNQAPLKWGYKIAELNEKEEEIKKTKMVKGKPVDEIFGDRGNAFLLSVWKDKIMKLEKSGVPTNAKRSAPKSELEPAMEEVSDGPSDDSDDLPF